MLQKGMTVEMAKVTNPTDMPNADRDDAIIVGISRDGDIFLGNQKTALDQITSLVRDRISNRVDKTVFIKSDGRAKYGDVVKLVDEVRSAGVDNVGLLTDKARSRRRHLRHRRPGTATGRLKLRWTATDGCAVDA